MRARKRIRANIPPAWVPRWRRLLAAALALGAAGLSCFGGNDTPEASKAATSALVGTPLPWAGSWGAAPPAAKGAPTQAPDVPAASEAIRAPLPGTTFAGFTAQGTYYHETCLAGDVCLESTTAVSALRGEPDYHPGVGFGSAVNAKGLFPTAFETNATVIDVTFADGQRVSYSKAADGKYYSPSPKDGTRIEKNSLCEMVFFSQNIHTRFERRSAETPYFRRDTFFPEETTLERDGGALDRVWRYSYKRGSLLTGVDVRLGPDPSGAHTLLQLTWTESSPATSGQPLVTRVRDANGFESTLAYAMRRGAAILVAVSSPSFVSAGRGATDPNAVTTLLSYGPYGHYNGQRLSKSRPVTGTGDPLAPADDNIVDGFVLELWDNVVQGRRKLGAPVKSITARDCRTEDVDITTTESTRLRLTPRRVGAALATLDTQQVDFDASYRVWTLTSGGVRDSSTTYTWATAGGRNAVVRVDDGLSHDFEAFEYDASHGFRTASYDASGGSRRSVVSENPLVLRTELVDGNGNPFVPPKVRGSSTYRSFRLVEETDAQGNTTSYDFARGLLQGVREQKFWETAPRTILQFSYGDSGCPADRAYRIADSRRGGVAVLTTFVCGHPTEKPDDGNAIVVKEIHRDGEGYPTTLSYSRTSPKGGTDVPLYQSEERQGAWGGKVADVGWNGQPRATEAQFAGRVVNTRAEAWDALGYAQASTAVATPLAGGSSIETLTPTLNTAGALEGAGQSAEYDTGESFRQTWATTVARAGAPVTETCVLPGVTLPAEGPTRPGGGSDGGPDGGDAGDAGDDAGSGESCNGSERRRCNGDVLQYCSFTGTWVGIDCTTFFSGNLGSCHEGAVAEINTLFGVPPATLSCCSRAATWAGCYELTNPALTGAYLLRPAFSYPMLTITSPPGSAPDGQKTWLTGACDGAPVINGYYSLVDHVQYPPSGVLVNTGACDAPPGDPDGGTDGGDDGGADGGADGAGGNTGDGGGSGCSFACCR